MGCNCGKKRTKPAGMGQRRAAEDQKKQDQQKKQGSGGTESFALQTPDRKVQTFGSWLEAEAERVRSGGRVVGRRPLR